MLSRNEWQDLPILSKYLVVENNNHFNPHFILFLITLYYLNIDAKALGNCFRIEIRYGIELK